MTPARIVPPLLALAGAALAGPVLAQPATPTTLALSAIGEVRATPDAAQLTLGVTTDAPTAAEAVRQTSERMTAVIAALKRQGAPDRDIRTQGLSVQPRYQYAPNEPPRLTGYEAANTVVITVEDVGKVGALLDAAVAAGANQANGLSFSLKDRGAAEDRARQEAVRMLKARAELYAQAEGLMVGRLMRLSEGVQTEGPQPLPLPPVTAMAARQGALPPVSAGEVDVRVQVNAVYELTR
jgi:uncharacterized protein YggE